MMETFVPMDPQPPVRPVDRAAQLGARTGSADGMKWVLWVNGLWAGLLIAMWALVIAGHMSLSVAVSLSAAYVASTAYLIKHGVESAEGKLEAKAARTAPLAPTSRAHQLADDISVPLLEVVQAAEQAERVQFAREHPPAEARPVVRDNLAEGEPFISSQAVRARLASQGVTTEHAARNARRFAGRP